MTVPREMAVKIERLVDFVCELAGPDWNQKETALGPIKNRNHITDDATDVSLWLDQSLPERLEKALAEHGTTPKRRPPNLDVVGVVESYIERYDIKK